MSSIGVEGNTEANSTSSLGKPEFEKENETKGSVIYRFAKNRLKEKEQRQGYRNIAAINLTKHYDWPFVVIWELDEQTKQACIKEEPIIYLEVYEYELTQVTAQLLVLFGDDPEVEVNIGTTNDNTGCIIETWLKEQIV